MKDVNGQGSWGEISGISQFLSDLTSMRSFSLDPSESDTWSFSRASNSYQFFSPLGVCVCVNYCALSAHVHAQGCSWACAHLCIWTQGQFQVSFRRYHLPCVLRYGFLLIWTCLFGRLACEPPGICLSLPPLPWDYKCVP